MLQNKTLSICNPIYNNEMQLPHLFESLFSLRCDLMNTVDSFEVIFSDNWSTDKSSDLIYNFRANFPECKIVRPAHFLNATESILFAIRKARFEYVWIIGDDSFAKEGMIESLKKLFQEDNDILITSSIFRKKNMNLYERVFANKLDYHPNIIMLLNDLKISYNHFFISNYVIRRKIAEVLFDNCETCWPHIEVLIKYFDSGINKIAITQSLPSIIEVESEWYSSKTFSKNKVSKMLVDLLIVSEYKSKSFNSEIVKLHARDQYKNVVKFTKIRLSIIYTLFLLCINGLSFTHLFFIIKNRKIKPILKCLKQLLKKKKGKLVSRCS